MATLTLGWDFRVTINDRDYAFTQPSTAPTITLSEVFEVTRTLATTLSNTVWSAGTAGHPASLDFFYFISTQNMLIEFTCNSGHAEDRVFAVPVLANMPFILTADNSTYNYTATADAFAGTADVIDVIRVYTLGAGTATFTAFVGKT